MNRYELTPIGTCCPVCACQEGHVLYSVDAAEASQHFVLRESAPERHALLEAHIETLWGRRTCNVVRCANCGFCFADPYIAGNARFYDLAYDRTGYPGWKWEYERTLCAMRTLLKSEHASDFTMLEVGAGDGAFIRRITPELMPKENVLCTEYSPYGKRQIEDCGVACVSADVRSLRDDRYKRRFSVVCMFQVLEHMDRLDQLLDHLTWTTRTPAHLFIAVPNMKRIEFNELNGSLLDMPPNHIGRWNTASFEILFRRHGWRMVEHATENESARNKAACHLKYRYLRQSQRPGSLANRIETVPSRVARRALQACAIALDVFRALPSLSVLLSSGNLGDSQWAHFEKTPAT